MHAAYQAPTARLVRMSPVSRGRKPKKSKKSQKHLPRTPGSGPANPRKTGHEPSIREPKSPLDALADRTDDPEWWPPAHQRVITASHALLKAQNPRALEQATAELIGAELHDAVREKRPGWRFEV